ncbi:peptidoglycan-binding protein [Diplodia corticola]|uniref:Peptidoglycan-binding protein n=1 Tax=Diplodia corticola TaxID=236234 RepID=A0A1J9QRB5_9PEZI|nr:peptidoglycan-binding protein [Diplodia corticola]OJD31486.1 peptidoglycan-binding protein [Diplodia corticola]
MQPKIRSKGRPDRVTVAQKRSAASSYQTVAREQWPDFFSAGKIFRIKISDGTLRVYVIVEPGERSSTCLMIKTYSGQATTRPDVRDRQNEHAVIYTMAQPPKPLRGEDKLRRPIGARAERQAQPFSTKTRLNYGQECDVPHTEPVCPLGQVLERDLSTLVADYLKVQRLKERRVISLASLPSFTPPASLSHDDSTGAMANGPQINLLPGPEGEADNALQLLDQHDGTPEALDCPSAGETDQNGTTQNIGQLEEPCDAVDIIDSLPFDNLKLDDPEGQAEPAERHGPPLSESNGNEGDSGLHILPLEDPADTQQEEISVINGVDIAEIPTIIVEGPAEPRQQGSPVTNETELAETEFPAIREDPDVPIIEDRHPLDSGADLCLDDGRISTSDIPGTEDTDGAVSHHHGSSSSSPGTCEGDGNLDEPVEQIDSTQGEAGKVTDCTYRILDEAEDPEPPEPSEQTSLQNPLNYGPDPEPLDTGPETAVESPYSIEPQPTPSVSFDWWGDWFQLAPYEIKASVCSYDTTPECCGSTHTTTTEDKSERSLSPEVADLNESPGLTASHHTSATGLDTNAASETCEETHENEPTVCGDLPPTASQDTSAELPLPASNEQCLNALNPVESSPIAPQPSLPSAPISPLSTASHSILNLPPSPAPSPKLSPIPTPPRSCPPEPDPVPPRRRTQRVRFQEDEQGSYTPQSRQSSPRRQPRYPFPPPQQYYAPAQPAFAMPGTFSDAPGPSMHGGYWSSHGIYQQAPPFYPAAPHPAYLAHQGPTPNSYASNSYHSTYSTRCDHYRQQQHQQQQQQKQQHDHHLAVEQHRPASPGPSEVTDSSSSSAAELEKGVYFYSAGGGGGRRGDKKTLLYALLDVSADCNFIRLDQALEAGLELRPCTHLSFWAGEGSSVVVRPKYIASGARWRFVDNRGGGGGGAIIWTDEFVVLEHMPRHDVIFGKQIIVKRASLLSDETLCVLGLEALTPTKEERKIKEDEERRKRLSNQERIKQQHLETRQQIIEKRQRKKLMQPRPESNKEPEDDEWYDCDEDSSVVATVGSRP